MGINVLYAYAIYFNPTYPKNVKIYLSLAKVENILIVYSYLLYIHSNLTEGYY